MERRRQDLRGISVSHDSIESFCAIGIESGWHAIKIGDQHLDVLVQSRGARSTLVVFHSALTPRETVLPVFQGAAGAEAAGVNLVAVADPSLVMGDIDLAWFLGNRFIGKLPPKLIPVIEHCLASIGSERTIVMGGSGGGYAALLYAQLLPGSIVLALNPRLDMTRLPFAKVDQYLRVCHFASGPTSRERIRGDFVHDRLSDYLKDGLMCHLLLWQNIQDRTFYDHQFTPFVQSRKSDPNLYTRLDAFGEGHRPVPRQALYTVLKALGSSTGSPDLFGRLGFSRPSI